MSIRIATPEATLPTLSSSASPLISADGLCTAATRNDQRAGDRVCKAHFLRHNTVAVPIHIHRIWRNACAICLASHSLDRQDTTLDASTPQLVSLRNTRKRSIMNASETSSHQAWNRQPLTTPRKCFANCRPCQHG